MIFQNLDCISCNPVCDDMPIMPAGPVACGQSRCGHPTIALQELVLHIPAEQAPWGSCADSCVWAKFQKTYFLGLV